MKKKEKTVWQIIRFRGKIETFLVSIDEFASFILVFYSMYHPPRKNDAVHGFILWSNFYILQPSNQLFVA